MAPQALLRILTALYLVSSLQAQLFDLSNGDSSGVTAPCGQGGNPGIWKFEEASKYPGGPTDGTVFTSDPTQRSCLVVNNLITLTENTNFNFKAFIPYSASNDVMTVWLVAEDQFSNYEWFKITGPIPSGSQWIERSVDKPAGVVTGKYTVEVWDTSTRHAISLRYFDITNQTITTAPPSTTEQTTTDLYSTEQTTTEPCTTEQTTTEPSTEISEQTTTELYSTETTEQTTTEPYTTGTTEQTTTEPTTTAPPITTCPPVYTCPPCNCYCNSPCCA